MKKLIITLFTILISGFVFDLCTARAFADHDVVYSFAKPPVTVCEDVSTEGVRVGYDLDFYADGVDYYMFLPSTADINSVRIRYDGSRVLFDQLSGQTFAPGTVLRIPLSIGENSICEYDAAEDKYYVYKFTVMSANNSMTIYLSLDGGWQDLLDIHSEKTNTASGFIRITDNGGEDRYNGRLEKIKGRGASSYAPTAEINTKNGYNIRLSNKTRVLSDAPKSKKWSLIAIRQWVYDRWAPPGEQIKPAGSSYDQSGLSYLNAYYTYNALVKDEYANICGEFADVYINGQYWGMYIVTEKMDTGGVFDIRDLDDVTLSDDDIISSPWGVTAETDPGDEAIKAGIISYYYDPSSHTAPNTDISGGYILAASSNADYYFVTSHGVSFEVRSPENPSREEMIYISRYVQEFEDALCSYTGYNALGRHYSEYVDIGSFESLMLVYSFYMNWELFRTSTFISKEADTSDAPAKLVFGPVWDFERRDFGEDNMFGTSGIYTRESQYAWTEWFWQHGELMSGMYDMNGEMKGIIAALLGEGGSDSVYSIREMTDNYAPSQEMNWIRWGMSGSFTSISDSVLENMHIRYDNWYGELWDDTKWLEGIYVDGVDNGDGSYKFTAHIRGTYSGDPVWYKILDNKTDMVEIARGETTLTVSESGIYLCSVGGLNNAYSPGATGEIFSQTELKMYSNPASTDDPNAFTGSNLRAGKSNWAKYRADELKNGLTDIADDKDEGKSLIRHGHNIRYKDLGYDLSDGKLLSGEPIGSITGNDNTEKTGRAAAFDKDPNTFFDPFLSLDYYYCGTDVKTPHILTKVRVLPKAGNPHRFRGAIIQGSNDQKTWYNMYSSDHEAEDGVWEEITEFDCNIGFRYYRYINRTEHGDVAELEFYGVEGQLAEVPETFEYDVSADYVKVYYDANGGTVKTDYSVVNRGGFYSGMPVPKRQDHIFTGWYTAKEGGVRIDESSKVNAIDDITVYARWELGVAPKKSTGLKILILAGVIFVVMIAGGVTVGKRRSMRY